VNYLYDSASIVEELSSSGTVLAKYTQGLGIDEPLAMNRGGSNSYYNADGLGTVTSLIDGSGSAAASYTYDAYGNPIAAAGSAVNPFRYTGREWDSETGLYYYRARYYEPQIGRFVSEDPLRSLGSGANLYAYVDNEPIAFRDPKGLCKSKKQDCIDSFLRSYYGNFVGNTVVPDFSLISIGTNIWGYVKSSALTLGAKGLLIFAPKGLSAIASKTGTNLAEYPGMTTASADAFETAAYWGTTAATAEWVVVPAAVGATAFSTAADAYARWVCRNVQ
jgi:RHS repeat-associated protein